ncbi:hypothetical protein QUB60_09745 [Microcoleus sp. A2-C5]|uniref:hypothetical protein n=1 Tax=Microcoleaceae TaxID=1892252 RepID=UPI00223806FC|nr:hypothetical protein [Lyngbya sp. CCAP 1446/10]MCW6051016.1 hypothetical protein [Lyngbya sp. CCAP 1446/10]
MRSVCEGRRKKEEGRRKKEEGRRKKEEGIKNVLSCCTFKLYIRGSVEAHPTGV